MPVAVFGLIIYGVADPYNPNATAPVIYTNHELPAAGRPALVRAGRRLGAPVTSRGSGRGRRAQGCDGVPRR